MKNRILKLSLICLFSLHVLFLQSARVEAANIERKLISEMGCDILVSGEITTGDSEALRSAISASDQEIARSALSATPESSALASPLIGSRPQYRRRVCFDSKGGSFLEGLQIAKLLIEYRKGAAVGAKMICESACALAFMGGSAATAGFEGSDDTDRVVHPLGLLGFHAPSLVVPNGQYNEDTVSRAYSVALATIKAFTETRNTVFRGYVPGTDQAVNFRYRFPESLLLEMISTPPEKMRHLRTVGEASRWDIRIAPIRFPEPISKNRRFAAACDNIIGYWSESTEFAFETPPFLEAQDGRLVSFDVLAASDLPLREGEGNYSPWRGARSDIGLRLIADVGEYWYECDVEVFENERMKSDVFNPVGGVIFESRRFFYPFQLFDPSTEISELTPQYGQPFEFNALILSLSEEVKEATTTEFLSCWLFSSTARITNVNEYVNLRQRPDFSARIIRQIPFRESVQALRADNVIVVGKERDRQTCISACRTFNADIDDRNAQSRAQQCINDNMLWYEITDAQGNTGWVSRKFLEDVE